MEIRRLQKLNAINLKKQNLLADCENCFALCCVALPYAKSSDFAFNKDSGKPCDNLQDNFLCSIHQELREKGFKGCTVYECFGAGQKVAQHIYNGKSWRDFPETAENMFLVFPIIRQLHEILYYLHEAAQRSETKRIHEQLINAYNIIESFTILTPEEILKLNVNKQREVINPLLIQSSKMIRETYKSKHMPRLKRELFGADLRNKKLSGASFRGFLLIAADLCNADLRGVDFIGADLRDANLSGAILEESIFLTQAQINAARGDEATKLPAHLQMPNHWSKDR
ncbi:pentapeptide repeat-containing protein [Gracilibacillus xinjiangensis]|uniref:Pentapeptide repeat-containing protein n=1 Tax=Gracilibacillus xinjiangensis TaxID=1193282 RepID=A0ABV8WRA6_9BACI